MHSSAIDNHHMSIASRGGIGDVLQRRRPLTYDVEAQRIGCAALLILLSMPTISSQLTAVGAHGDIDVSLKATRMSLV